LIQGRVVHVRLGNLFERLATVLDIVLQTLLIVIFINAILSWVRPDPTIRS
jgi:cytochrome c oxidase subunit IV